MTKIKVFIFGISGKMGKHLIECSEQNNCEVVGGFDRVSCPNIATFSNIQDVNVSLDVIVDFSRPETLDCIISLASKCRAPVVLATTGYDKNQQQKIDELATIVPVFQTGNMSLGINVISQLVSTAVKLLGSNFDKEIIEMHHNQKVDAPSGTAQMLADSINGAMNDSAQLVFGREGITGARKNNEVGIHSIRGGSIVGEHEVLFCGTDEVIKISHSSGSRKVFANGALRAVNFIAKLKPGKYNMNDLLK